MNDLERLRLRFRAIKLAGISVFVVTLLVWLTIPAWRSELNGLLIGEVGGAYVVYSLIRQGHLNDGLEGTALFASGMLGTFTRLLVLAVVMIAAIKLPHVNVYAALIGYLLGFVLIFAGLYGFARNRRTTLREK
ncbi:hypothetical protein LLE49_20755 [Alicyclobacillus tolerans]|uniref:hypothetical protein n=1 Tax=Alicyclobacillus tolerans TaxID=90970 RepID=UPI001F210DE8|nr:hypothetical protein [Alicyclobacillus tolerans]MCF8567153.1 hypothetical protein [Alicyclobacillus tolerans]